MSDGMTVGGQFLDARALRPGFAAMQPGLGVDYFENWDVAKAMLPACRRRGLNATYVADRLLQRERKAGRIKHRGKGQWVRCDRDGTLRRPEGAQGEACQPGRAKTRHRPTDYA